MVYDEVEEMNVTYLPSEAVQILVDHAAQSKGAPATDMPAHVTLRFDVSEKDKSVNVRLERIEIEFKPRGGDLK